MVGVVESALAKTIGKRILKTEEMNTLLYKAAAVVNSRPLAYIYDEPVSTILRPMDFLQTGEAMEMLPVGDVEEEDYIPPQEKKELVHLYKTNLKKIDTYWDYFQSDYILSLRERHQMNHKDSNKGLKTLPKPGQVVLVKEPNLRRGEWELGRVTNIQKQNIGYVKNVEIVLPNKKAVVWPLSQWFPVECNPNVIFEIS